MKPSAAEGDGQLEFGREKREARFLASLPPSGLSLTEEWSGHQPTGRGEAAGVQVGGVTRPLSVSLAQIGRGLNRRDMNGREVRLLETSRTPPPAARESSVSPRSNRRRSKRDVWE